MQSIVSVSGFSASAQPDFPIDIRAGFVKLLRNSGIVHEKKQGQIKLII